MAKVKHIKIINRDKTSSNFFEFCDSFKTRMRGLMFRKKPAYLYFTFDLEDLNPIHSFFVLFPFDAIYLNSAHEVVGVFENVQPFTAYIEPKQVNTILLETPAGFVKHMQIKEGDKLKIEIE